MLFLCLLLLTACQSLPAPSITTDERSAAAVLVEADRFILDIHSERGIGAAQVETNGVDAERITVRLHLAGLEEFRFAYDDVEVMASISSSDGDVRQVVNSDSTDVEPVDENSPYWLHIATWTKSGEAATAIPNPGGFFELTPPADFVESKSEMFAISWIDFYR